MLDLDINDAEQGIIQGHKSGYIRSIAISQILIVKELQKLNQNMEERDQNDMQKRNGYYY